MKKFLRNTHTLPKKNKIIDEQSDDVAGVDDDDGKRVEIIFEYSISI